MSEGQLVAFDNGALAQLTRVVVNGWSVPSLLVAVLPKQVGDAPAKPETKR